MWLLQYQPLLLKYGLLPFTIRLTNFETIDEFENEMTKCNFTKMLQNCNRSTSSEEEVKLAITYDARMSVDYFRSILIFAFSPVVLVIDLITNVMVIIIEIENQRR